MAEAEKGNKSTVLPRKTFVIDTNVLIHRPDAILSFKDSDIVIPLWVLEELDKLKTYSDERGRNARHAIRFIDKRAKGSNLSHGTKIENGSMMRIELDYDRSLADDFNTERADNKIILTAMKLDRSEKTEVFFVSKDINARVKARALGIKAVDYEKQKTSFTKLYKGYQEGSITSQEAEELAIKEFIPFSGVMLNNQFLMGELKDTSESFVARYNSQRQGLQRVDPYEDGVFGIVPLNAQQIMSLDVLLDDEISLVTLIGQAGTGKTLLALVAGLKKVFESKTYTRLLVTRPIMPLGKDLGFLPGDKEAKLTHWMKPIYDNLELIVSQHPHAEFKTVEHLLKGSKVEIEAITYIRGRSLPKQYIIIDEAQNLSPHEIKTIVSRAGKGSKIVLTGDPYQIDTPYLDSDSNGLTYLVEILKGQSLYGHVTLEKTERSPLAELAAELL